MIHKSEVKRHINYPKKPKIKWVKKAQMWCKTTFEFGKTVKQMQEWSEREPKD